MCANDQRSARNIMVIAICVGYRSCRSRKSRRQLRHARHSAVRVGVEPEGSSIIEGGAEPEGSAVGPPPEGG
eukprot:5698530-Heterocapsa_arctica.AAC.1